MPRLLAVGHVTWDQGPGGAVLGGCVSYAARAAARLGWDAAVLTAAGDDFDAARDLPDVTVFASRSRATTRFENAYERDGTRRQRVASRAGDVDLSALPAAWRDPEALLLAPVMGELPPRSALAFSAELVGAAAQGWLREVDEDGDVSPRDWPRAADDLEGVHALFLSEQDLPDAERRAPELLRFVHLVALTRGWQGLTLITRQGAQPVPGLPRPEVDPTGAGDVFAAAFLVRYHETGDALEAAAFGACAASCAVECVGASALGSRAEVERRLVLRERLIEEGEWDD